MNYESLLAIYKLRFKGSFILKNIAYKMLRKQGIDISSSVQIGKNLVLPHPYGIIIHPQTTIEDNVKIYQGVTIGRGDIYNDEPALDFHGFRICEGAILCAGAKVLCTHGTITIGKNSIVGANAVVTSNVPDNIIVAGVPARAICGHSIHK